MAETLNTRVTSLEESMRRAFAAIEALAEKEKKLDDVLVLLTEAQIATQQRFGETDARIDRLVESQMQTEERFRQTEERFRQTDERFLQMGERVENLVSAIGALLRDRPI